MAQNLTTEDGDLIIYETSTTPRPLVSGLQWEKVAVAILLTLLVLVTSLSNLVVLIAFYTEKKLRSTFTYFIANLAVTDFLVSLTAMAFYTVDTVLGYWPFGQFLCGVWIFCDYSMIFASVFTLVAISVDRFWAVMWSLSYRSHNSKRKPTIILTCIWVLVVIICLPPCIIDRLKWSEPEVCWWDPSKNIEFAYFLALVGHHLPCVAIVFCYICVFIRTRKQLKIKPGEILKVKTKHNPDSRSNVSQIGIGLRNPTTSSTAIETVAGNSAEPPVQSARTARSHVPAPSSPRDEQSHQKLKEKKMFKTLSYIMITYMICWVPFHIIYDLSFVSPDLISARLYTFGFWMTYLNSTLNPIIYAFSNMEIRQAAKRVIMCKCKL